MRLNKKIRYKQLFKAAKVFNSFAKIEKITEKNSFHRKKTYSIGKKSNIKENEEVSVWEFFWNLIQIEFFFYSEKYCDRFICLGKKSTILGKNQQ